MVDNKQIVQLIDNADMTIRRLIKGSSDLNVSSLLQDIAVSEYIIDKELIYAGIWLNAQ